MELHRIFAGRMHLKVFLGTIAIILLQGCTTVHRMNISQHTSVTPVLTNARADQIAADMTTILNTNDGPGDMACTKVRFERDGAVTTFSATTGSINSSANFSTVIGLPGRVKLVNQINWCGVFLPNVIGCAPVPGDSLAVIRFTQNQEGVLWLHEFGHNMGLPHRNGSTLVMNPTIGVNRRMVNSTECAAYR